MLSPRLTVLEAVSQAKFVSPNDVVVGEPRLFHLNEEACRRIIGDDPSIASFVEWSDRSMGIVFFQAFPSLEFALAAAYGPARFTLEHWYTVTANSAVGNQLN